MFYERICILIAVLAASMYVAFKHTPELDGVKHSAIFRYALGMMFTWAALFFLFSMLGLFPLE